MPDAVQSKPRNEPVELTNFSMCLLLSLCIWFLNIFLAVAPSMRKEYYLQVFQPVS